MPWPRKPHLVPLPPFNPHRPRVSRLLMRSMNRPTASRSGAENQSSIDQDYTVRAGETVSEIVLIFGSLKVEGRVQGDAVVIFGKVEIAGTGAIEGDLVNIGGGVDVASGGSVRGDLVSIAGVLTAAETFSPGGEQVVIGSTAMGNRLRAFVPWVTSGLMLGRVVVPSLPWVWVFLAAVFFITLVLGIVFETPVRACAEAIDAKPLTTFLTGLLVLLLVGPASFLLAVSVVGIAVLPFMFCALLIAVVIGKVAVSRWLGWRIVRESDPDSRMEVVRSLVIGFAILTVLYMLPVVGVVTWATISVLALGAANTTVFKALRRENPTPPKPPVAPVPAPTVMPATPPPQAASFSADAVPMEASSYAPPVADIPLPTPPPEWTAASPLLALPRATFYRRVAAGLLDSFLVFIVFLMLDIHRREPFWFLALLTAYNAAFWTWRGTTIGGIICNLRVVRTDGRPLVFGDSIIRGLSSIFSLLAFGIGFLWIHLDSNRERQAWHDVIAGTVVVQVPRSEPLR